MIKDLDKNLEGTSYEDYITLLVGNKLDLLKDVGEVISDEVINDFIEKNHKGKIKTWCKTSAKLGDLIYNEFPESPRAVSVDHLFTILTKLMLEATQKK